MLHRYAGVMPVASLCRMLGRSEHSVRAKARTMGLDVVTVSPYWFTTYEVALAFRVGHGTVNSWVRKGLLVPTDNSGKARLTIQQLHHFYHHHPHLPSVAKVDWETIEHRLKALL
jgi:hypothetical protein